VWERHLAVVAAEGGAAAAAVAAVPLQKKRPPSPTRHQRSDDETKGGGVPAPLRESKRARVDGTDASAADSSTTDIHRDTDAAAAAAAPLARPPEAPPPEATRTYLPLMEQMDPDALKAVLGAGWVAVDMDTAFAAGHVDLVFLDGFKNFERKLWSLKCGVCLRPPRCPHANTPLLSQHAYTHTHTLAHTHTHINTNMIFVRTMCVSYSTVSSSTALSILCSHFPPVHLHSLHHAAHAPMSCALNILSVQVKSRIEAQQITIKTRLHELLTRECPGKFIPETRVLRRGARHVLPPNSVCGSTTVCRQWRECEQPHAHNHTHTHTHTHTQTQTQTQTYTHARFFTRRSRSASCLQMCATTCVDLPPTIHTHCSLTPTPTHTHATAGVDLPAREEGGEWCGHCSRDQPGPTRRGHPRRHPL
jgi:hypothetical protein